MIDLETMCRKAVEDDTPDALDCAAYHIGFLEPNYPLPAIRQRTFESLRKLGYSSAENAFPIDVVFEYYIKI